MKKDLALALALCMMLAMGTVAFAYGETINKDTVPQSGSTLVKTDADLPTEPGVPGGDEEWTVTIPAELVVPWDNEEDSASETQQYTLDATLAATSDVTVTVAPFGEKALTMTCGDDSLLATIDGDESIKVSGNDTASGDVFASITAADFDAAPVGLYQGELTFTVVYDNHIVA